MTVLRALALSLLAALAVAAPASAGEISVTGGVLTITGGTDVVDADVVQDGGDYDVFDYALTLDPGEGCSLDTPEPPVIGPIGDRTITCQGPVSSVSATVGGEFNFLYVLSSVPKRFAGGPSRDFLIGAGSGPTEARGEGGSDSLRGGDADDLLDGGPDDDDLSGGEGADHLLGGDGRDDLVGDSFEFSEEGPSPSPSPGSPAPTGGAPDLLEGGEGSDTLSGGGGADRLLGGPGRDSVNFQSDTPMTVALGVPGGEDELTDIENVTFFGKGDATIRGDARTNEIATGEGKDVVDPGPGFDKVDTGRGDDSVNARDGFPDYVICGEGTDSVVADAEDDVEKDCENVDRAPAASAPGPATPAAPAVVRPTGFTVRVRSKGRLAIVTGRLTLPAGAPASLCTGGGVTLEIKGLGRRAIRTGTVLGSTCTFTMRVRGKGRRVRVKARFAGTPALAPATATSTR